MIWICSCGLDFSRRIFIGGQPHGHQVERIEPHAIRIRSDDVIVGALIGVAINMVLALAPHTSVDANAPAIETKGC